MFEAPIVSDPSSRSGRTPTDGPLPVAERAGGSIVEHVGGAVVEMTSDACFDLLRTEEVGRLGVVVLGRPEIFPVNYTLDASDSVILRTASGKKLVAAVNNPVVFEVDRFDRGTQAGWSVIVHAVAHRTQRVAPGEKPLRSWHAGTAHLLRLSSTSVSGRRIGSGDARGEAAAANH
jgi:hypothetical protein